MSSSPLSFPLDSPGVQISEVVRKVVRISEGKLHSALRFHIERRNVVFHLRPNSRNHNLLVNFFKTLGRVLSMEE